VNIAARTRCRDMPTTCDECGALRAPDDPWYHVRIGAGVYRSQTELSVRRLCPDCCLALGWRCRREENRDEEKTVIGGIAAIAAAIGIAFSYTGGSK
jgi:hypothetical protein